MRRLLLLALAATLAGCQAGYYLHLASGHLSLMRQRTPVAELLADAETPAALRQRLARVNEMLAFAEQALALPVDDAYRTFVALERGFVVWNLFAAPEFSLAPVTWCYPVAGCTSYRGYFDIQRAERDAERLRAQGLDVYGGGAIAYSTLGWFSDPLTTPMLQGSEAEIAELLFHELAHRRFYLKGDTRFNESLATSVGREGARRWLAQHGDPAAVQSLIAADIARARVLALVAQTRAQLATLYAAAQGDEQQLRDGKAAAQAQLREAFEAAQQDDPQVARYRHWFAGPLNNAQLATLNDYNGWVPAFDAVLLHCGGRWACFWHATTELAALPQAQRDAALTEWMTP